MTEIFEFKKNGKCIRTLEYGNTLTFDCTYEISKDGIKIIWDEKKDKVFEEYEYVDSNTIKINGGSSRSANVPGFSSEFVSDVLPTLDTFIDIKVSGSVEAAGYDFPKNIRIVKSNGYIITYDNPGIEFVGYRFNKNSIITIQYTKNI